MVHGGLSKERLGRMHGVMARHVEQGRAPGLVTLVSRRGETHDAGGFLGAGRGWGFGVSVITRRDEVAATPGRFGWEGGLGTSWASC